MQIDKLSIVTQPRTSWQAFDLGCKMTLQWYKPLWLFWLIVTLPVFLIANLVSLEYGMILLWLTKPLYERGLLYIFSRRVFGEMTTAKEALKAWPSQLKNMWLSSISWRRFGPSRGFNLAVTQLEGLTGGARSKRLQVLHRTEDDNAAWWTIICLHWEMFILFGLIAIANFIIPQGLELNLYSRFFDEDEAVTVFAYNSLLYLVYWLVAPFYIGGSFAAYLNRRIILEAWDIELSFKQLIGSRKSPKVAASIIVVLCSCLFIPSKPSLATESAAQDAAPQQTTAQQTLETPVEVGSDVISSEQAIDDKIPEVEPKIFESQTRLKSILSNPPFAQDKIVKDFRWVSDDDDEEEPEPPPSFPKWLASLFLFIANIGEVLMWAAFGVLLIILLYLSRDHIARVFSHREKQDVSDLSTFIPSFTQSYVEEQLPEDVEAEIEALLAQFAYRKLMSLLLITSLIEISKHQALPLRKSMTERECLQVIKASVQGQQSEFMHSLIDTWVKLAWAHRMPSTEQMQTLCESWKLLFSVAGKSQ